MRVIGKSLPKRFRACQPVEQLLVRQGAVVGLIRLGILVVLHEADHGGDVAEGPKATLRHVLFHRSRPHFHESVSSTALLREVEVDPLDASGRALVLEAGEVLVEEPLV